MEAYSYLQDAALELRLRRGEEVAQKALAAAQGDLDEARETIPKATAPKARVVKAWISRAQRYVYSVPQGASVGWPI